MGEQEGLLPWMPAGASSWSCLFCHNKKSKAGFECERTRTSEKWERQKGGEKSWDLTV